MESAERIPGAKGVSTPLSKQLQGHEGEHEEAEHEEQEDVGDLWQRVADATEGPPDLPGTRQVLRGDVEPLFPLTIPSGSNPSTEVQEPQAPGGSYKERLHTHITVNSGAKGQRAPGTPEMFLLQGTGQGQKSITPGHKTHALSPNVELLPPPRPPHHSLFIC